MVDRKKNHQKQCIWVLLYQVTQQRGVVLLCSLPYLPPHPAVVVCRTQDPPQWWLQWLPWYACRQSHLPPWLMVSLPVVLQNSMLLWSLWTKRKGWACSVWFPLCKKNTIIRRKIYYLFYRTFTLLWKSLVNFHISWKTISMKLFCRSSQKYCAASSDLCFTFSSSPYSWLRMPSAS